GSVRVSLFDKGGKRVTLLDDTGQERAELDSGPVYDLDANDFLIVDVTVPRKCPHAAWIDSRRVQIPGEAVNQRRVRSMTPAELPRRWHGLEPVDAIVWDDADPSSISQQ